ncbi:MAG: hypothetical protein EHM24_15320 [Acidobacteria bacterium]|nr:MAG: hypothetical protein EHM24_15320 [Acidobacteriota bacterium]
MKDEIDRLRDLFVTIWEGADPHAALDGPELTGDAHARNEAELSAFVDVLESESRGLRRRAPLGEEGEQRVFSAFARFAVDALGWDRDHLEGPLAGPFREALRAFPIRARRFDPSLTAADIYQAARNALTLHCLQGLLGARIEHTPALLAYSLLYPYTDNLLDDPRAGSTSKLAFGRRLGERLRGGEVAPAGDREARIFSLVGMIERQYPRARFPRVFDSLLAIHDAQVRSLALMSGAPVDARTLIEVAVEKGGTSVLADGYLVSGSLTPQQAECIFGLGVFLQLRDDLEDLHDDAAAGVGTVFSARNGGGLDEPTARALAIGAAVLGRLACFDSSQAAPLREIMARSLPLTIADAAASYPTLYSRGYLGALERRSPFRFGRLAAQRRRLSRARGSLTGLLERWLDEWVARAPGADDSADREFNLPHPCQPPMPS